MFLVAGPAHRDQAGRFQTRQLALHGTRTRLRKPDQLIGVKRAEAGETAPPAAVFGIDNA
jgi:hypothetical protein